MKGFFGKFNFIMKNRKHFFFLVVVWTVLAVSTLVYGLSLRKAVRDAFAQEKGKEGAYTFEIEGEEKVIASNEVLRQEVALNELLCNDENFSYCTYVNTTCTMSELNNLELSVDADSNSEREPADGQKSYKVRLLMIDEKTAESSGLKTYKYIFDINTDYVDSVPVLIGSEWKNEGISMGVPSRDIITDIDNYTIQCMGTIAQDVSFVHEQAEISLDKYIIFPLGTLTDIRFPTTQEGRNRWYDIYRVKNQGIIHTDMTPNTLQKYLDDLMDENQLPYRLLVNEADHDNRILFRDDVDSVTSIVVNVGYVAIIIAALMMIFYLIRNYDISSAYLFVSYVSGTGKAEFIFISLLQMAVFFFMAAVPSYIIVVLLVKLTASATVSVAGVCVPVAILTFVGIVTNIVRILLWDAGKKLRTIED